MLKEIAIRKSPYQFDSEFKLTEEKVLSLIEAASFAPSSYNEQPWRFAFGIKGTEQFELILNSLVEPNQEWAKHASVLLVALTRNEFSRNGKNNRHASYDTGQAMAFLSLEATHQGLSLHQMGGFYHEELVKSLGVDGELEAISVTAIGKSAEDMSTKERSRIPVGDLVIE